MHTSDIMDGQDHYHCHCHKKFKTLYFYFCWQAVGLETKLSNTTMYANYRWAIFL